MILNLGIYIVILQLGLRKIHTSSFSIIDTLNTVASAGLYGPRGQLCALQPGPVAVLSYYGAPEKRHPSVSPGM